MIKKDLECIRVKTAMEKSSTFVASSDNVDRMGDVINQSGWKLDAYEKNPVILFNHDSRALPIGRGSVDVIDGKLMIDVTFDDKDEFAQQVKSKVDGGFLNAVSVGFNPIKAYDRNSLPIESKYFGERGTYFESAELLEVSIVTIPANGEATAAKSMDADALDHFARLVSKHILQVMEEEGKYTIVYAAEEPVEQAEEPVEPIEEQGSAGYELDEDEKDKEKDFEDELIRALIAY